MGFMKYNIDFEIIGSIIMLVIIIFFKLKFDRQTESEKCFIKLAYSVLAAQVLDMATAVTISIGGPKLALFNLIFDTIYFSVEIYMGLLFIDYIVVAAHQKMMKKIRTQLQAFGTIYTLILVINMFAGFYFRFDFETGEYIHGPWYYTLYIVPGFLTVYAAGLMIWYRKKFATKQWISVCSFILFSVIGLLLQGLFVPDIYLSFGLVTISFLMIVFSLETPDYRKLMQTMDELEEAKKDAESAREEAERANRVKGDFLAHMSHEIRTPINSILGFDEIILRDSKDQEITQYASNIKLSGQTLLALINDILDFSKIESGKMEIVPVDYELKSLITDMILMVTPRAEDKGLKIRCEIDENLPCKLHGDDVRIRQVITNLLTNAVKYTEQGEVVLAMSLVSLGEKVSIKVSVRDTGIGIKEEDKAGLFNAFKRVDEMKNRHVEGTGLGLAICVRTLELMNSKLTVDSEYGKGSDFYFVLEQSVIDSTPIGKYDMSEEEGRRNVEITRENFTAPEANILVVDDVPLNLVLVQKLMKNSKMNIDTAGGGLEALDKIRENDYDIVFLDHLMPEMDGIETLKKGIEEGILDPKVLPVVALTANAISGAREMFLSEGFTDYLSKPIVIKDFLALLIKYLPDEKIILNEDTEN